MKRRSFLVEVQRLGHHLPVLGGALGVIALSIACTSTASHVVRRLIGNGGDVAALLTVEADGFAGTFAKAMVWGEKVLAFLGL
ncbi:MAG: hypothetical protein HOP13_06570 [Alphaproteobacteria bacterium]|nr:hypothetical protein [Alphaproteobacteria bacterium]